MKGCIYRITNNINDEIYIGQTTKHPISRLGRHISSAYSSPTNQLHEAIKEYGFKNFDIEILEDSIDKKDLRKKEQYYIDKYNPAYNNYMIVCGISDTKEKEILNLHKQGLYIYEISERTRIGYLNTMKVLHKHGIRTRDAVDKDKVVKLYAEGFTAQQVAEKLNISSTSVLDKLKEENQTIRGHRKSIVMKTLEGEVVKEFSSGRQAGRYIFEQTRHSNLDNCSKHINSCCRGVSKTAYGYKWEYNQGGIK